MFKKTHPIRVATFFWVFTVQGMEENSSVPLKNYVFDGSNICYSLSSDSEEEIDECIDQFHIVQKENFDMIAAIVKKPIVILDDYQNSSNIEKVPDIQEVIHDSGSVDNYFWTNERYLKVENYLDNLKELKNKIFTSRDTEQRH